MLKCFLILFCKTKLINRSTNFSRKKKDLQKIIVIVILIFFLLRNFVFFLHLNIFGL